MATVTVRQLDEKTKALLRIRAAQHGHSMEQEARNILQQALTSPPPSAEPWYEQIRRSFAEIGGADDLVIPPREYVEPRVIFEDE